MPHSLQIRIARAALLVAAACLLGTLAVTLVKIRAADPTEATTGEPPGSFRTTAKSAR